MNDTTILGVDDQNNTHVRVNFIDTDDVGKNCARKALKAVPGSTRYTYHGMFRDSKQQWYGYFVVKGAKDD